MDITIKGPWQQGEIDEYLSTARFPLRLACVADDGFPRVVSIWFQYNDGVFHCAAHRDSQLIRMLRKSQRVGFEVSTNEPPYFGVRGQGTVELSEEGAADTLGGLIRHYLGDTNSQLAQWLLSRGDEEVLIRLNPQRFFSWDYRTRMEAIEEGAAT